MTLLASTTTSATGSYAVSVADSAAIDQAAAWNNGQVNVDLTAVAGSYTYNTTFPRKLINGVWTGGTTARYAPVRAQVLRLPPGSRGLATPLQLAVAQGRVPDNGGCNPPIRQASGQPEQDQVVVGELHAANDMFHDSFQYGTESDSSTDVGLSYSNAIGSWNVSGTFGFTTGGGGGGKSIDNIDRSLFGHQLTVGFVFQKYHYYYIPATCGRPYYKIYPTGWNLGIHIGADNFGLDGYCLSKYPAYTSDLQSGNVAIRDANSYTKFTYAATINLGTGGLTIGNQSGMSQYVEQEWEPGGAIAHHYICGNDAPDSRSSRIFAGS